MFTVLALIAVLSAVNVALLVYLLFRAASSPAEQIVREELRQSREELARSSRDLREEVSQRVTDLRTSVSASSHELRDEVARSLKSTSDSLIKTIGELGLAQKASQDTFAHQTKQLQGVVETQLKSIQETNDKKLEEIRRTVDEQLQNTLEKRLTESFRLVSGHLESVQRGLGEMQALATGVGDLKRVLTNVKARGTWAEYQLGAILEEILTPDQFQKNVQVKELSSERVEYAVRLPGRNGDPTSCVWLPIDSKFPRESYDRLMDAQERGDIELVQAATVELARNIRGRAQEIQDKYLNPPATTDFGVLFLPTEGLYAEVLRIPNLASDLQQKCRVMVAGPTNLAALLSSLRIGFQTLAIERRASEVWAVLRAVKTEFAKFGGVLAKVKKQLESATRTIELTDVRARVMQKKLRDVEGQAQLPPEDLLQLPQELGMFEFAEAQLAMVDKPDPDNA